MEKTIKNRVHQNSDASGNNLRNSSVDADMGSVVLADTTICRVGIFSFVRRTKRSSTIPLQGMIPAVIMEMTVRDLRMVFQFHFAPFLAL